MALKVTSGAGSGSSTILSASSSFTFRGVWATGTNYSRGDVVIDPNTIGSGKNPTLRFTNKTHTAPASFVTGNENSDIQWLQFTTSGPFHGPWEANVWLTQGDLIVEPTGGTIVASRKSQNTGATYDSTMFGTPITPIIAGVRPDVQFPITGIPDFGELDVGGLWVRRSKIQTPRGSWLLQTANGAELSTSGAGSLAAESDAPGPGGAVKINFPQQPIYALGSTTDLTANILRLYTKLIGSTAPPSNGSPGTWPNTSISDIYLDVSSSASFANYHRARLVHSGDTTNQIPTGAWFWQGAGPADWVLAAGSGANLASITHVRISCSTPANAVTGVAMSVFGINAVPNGQKPDGSIDAGRKAKVVLIFDDDQSAAWDTAAQPMFARNFPGVLASTIAQTAPSASSSLTGPQLRHLTNACGWQVITHAYSQNEHSVVNDPQAMTIGGIGLRAQHMKSRHAQNVHGTFGGDDFAMFGNNSELNADVVRALRQNFRSGSRFIGLPRLCETLPPMDPHLMWNWGASGSDAADASDKLAYVDKAIAQKGLAVFRFHAIPTEFTALLDGLVTRRNAGTIDVVTLADALGPWTVAP